MEQIFQRLAPSCAMLLTRNPATGAVDFLGSAFAVRQEGYLFTTAELVKDRNELLVSPAEDPAGFQPASRDKLNCFPAAVVKLDLPNNLALLKLIDPAQLRLPPDLLGDSLSLLPGTPLMHLGFAFGRHGSLPLIARSGILCAKVQGPAGSRQLLVEGSAYSGAAGGPLIDARRGRIVGVMLSPLALLPQEAKTAAGKFALPLQTDLSIAAPIEAAVALLQTAS
ncbi:MAG TPA: serine protease [Gammaproteobacteria bacterium]|nr:serine protease [Gammaproteobacteria bacterium]